MSILAPPVSDPASRLLISTRDAATLLSVSERTIWSMCRDGRLASVRIGRALRISTDELRRGHRTPSRAMADERARTSPLNAKLAGMMQRLLLDTLADQLEAEPTVPSGPPGDRTPTARAD